MLSFVHSHCAAAYRDHGTQAHSLLRRYIYDAGRWLSSIKCFPVMNSDPVITIISSPREIFVFLTLLQMLRKLVQVFSDFLPCYVNIENLCMLFSLSATLMWTRCRSICVGTSRTVEDAWPEHLALSRANFYVVIYILNISPSPAPLCSVDPHTVLCFLFFTMKVFY